jgi:hypothetical protein
MIYRASSLIKFAIFNLSSALNSLRPLEDGIDISTELVGAGGSTNRTTFVALGACWKYKIRLNYFNSN